MATTNQPPGSRETRNSRRFDFNLETGFDPYSMRLANGLRSLVENDADILANQSANGDSSRAGQIFNTQAYAGLSNNTFGALTFGRQSTLTLDGVRVYDPMSATNAFSVIGDSAKTAGVGDTEDARFTTATKYVLNIGPFRVAS